VSRQGDLRLREGRLVAVDCQEAATGLEALRYQPRVAARADGTVDDDRTRSGLQQLYGLF